MGLTQHTTGTDIVASLLNLILATGMIGRWGAAMIPIRGQNNVQGASDVGAIPFVYTDYQSVDRSARSGTSSRTPGACPRSASPLKLGPQGDPDRGRRGARSAACSSWARTRPLRPEVSHAEHWFRELEFLAVQDLFLTETARYADVVLPGASFAEKDGDVREHRPPHPALEAAQPIRRATRGSTWRS